MSMLEAAGNYAPSRGRGALLSAVPTLTDEELALRAPYRRGDRICATTPEGARYLVRVESVKPTGAGQFSVVGAVTEPRKFRSHVLSTVVGPDGYGPAVRRA